jgi:hypothetical protein
MTQTRDWKGMKDMSVRLLVERTGEDLNTWNQRIKGRALDEKGAYLALTVTGTPRACW